MMINIYRLLHCFVLLTACSLLYLTLVLAEESKFIHINVADAVIIALQNNIDVKSAYMDRNVQRYDLRLAEDKFTPKSGLNFGISRSSAYDMSSSGRTNSINHQGDYQVALTIPTGGNFTFTWANLAEKPEVGQDYGYNSSWSLNFRQPLLKGGGKDNAVYSINVARLIEVQNILVLQDILAATITKAITSYRNYVSSKRQLSIVDQSLEAAKKIYEINEALLKAGRRAEMELVETKANIAIRELDVLQATNAVESARLNLIQTLNIDKDTQIDTFEEKEIQVSPPTLNEGIDIAKKNRRDYLWALQNIEIKKWDIANAKRNRLWNLNLEASTTDGEGFIINDSVDSAWRRAVRSGSERNWSIGLTMDIPLNSLTQDERNYLSAKIELKKATMMLTKMERDLEIAVQNAIRDVETNYRQMELAKQARELSEKKLEVENEKLRVGRTSNFQVVSYQNDLSSSQVSELTAVINYLNALTTLDETLGTTLLTWKIEVTKEDDKVNLPEASQK
ncbi:MAG: TolC family protein [Desulfobacterales bacterium]|nr:TolC family protein [Desulfobacterales bacterium]